MKLKRRGSKKVFDELMAEASQCYFHGIALKDYLKDGALERLHLWLGDNLSYEFAALAMILLKWNETAVLYHGEAVYKNGHNVKRAWVEIRVGTSKYVVDFSAGQNFLYRKAKYFGKNGVGRDYRALWYCTHERFWNIPYANTLWEAMQYRGRSYILRDLSGFGRPDSYALGFEYWVPREDVLRFSCDGRYMVPYQHSSDSSWLIGTEVIQDFAKKAKRHQPKSRSVRKVARDFRRANH